MHAPVRRRPDLHHSEPERSAAYAPSFTIDVAAGALLAANSAGWALWGMEPASAALRPVALDHAMPALQALRATAAGAAGDGPLEAGPIALTFWTPRGVLPLRCLVERASESGWALTLHVVSDVRGVGGAPLYGGSREQVALTAWLAHELRTPLAAAIACSELLKSEHFGPLGDPRYRDYARAIYDSSRHALSMVDGILRGDPTRAGVPPLAFADLDPVSLVESCLTVTRPLADRAGLELRGEYAPRLPRVVADELSIRQVLLNLLGNAVKFARRGDRVSVSIAYRADGALAIAVADTGPGMASATEPTRTPTGPRTATGLGLGLPLSRALAAANGAEFAIESAPGEGTRVTIAFPPGRVVPV